jgi:hypothetical protein
MIHYIEHAESTVSRNPLRWAAPDGFVVAGEVLLGGYQN